MAYAGLKRVEVFKTNVEREQDANQLLSMLSQNFPWFDVHFDLEDCDHILRVEGHAVSNEQIISLLSKYGYQCTALV
jgi:tRNA G26 N,N-dimethylase Trm1